MDPVVLIMVASIYIGAIAAPLAVYVMARRTGHGMGWQAATVLCGGLIWLAMTLGFLQEMMNVTLFAGILEPVGFLAVVAFAVLAVMALALAAKDWPHVSHSADDPIDPPAQADRRYDRRMSGRFVTDIE